MTKLTLQDMASGFNSQTTYNENNTAIEAAVENTLSRDGSIPNQMLSDLDMNSQEITNASAIRTGSLYVNGQLIIANSVDVVGKQVYSATATAGQTLFTGIGAYTQGVAALDVYINGVYQDNTQYAETSTTSITFTTGLSVGDYVVVVSVSDQTIVSLLPTGGTTGQILTKDSVTDGDASWQTGTTYNITDNSDATFLTVDVDENATFAGELNVSNASPEINLIETDSIDKNIEIAVSAGDFSINRRTDADGYVNTFVNYNSSGQLTLSAEHSVPSKMDLRAHRIDLNTRDSVLGSTGGDEMINIQSDVTMFGYFIPKAVTQAALRDITNAINTGANKVAGAMLWDSTNSKPVWATGAADGDTWVDGVGTLAHTPV
jgi:hypothetical protein